MKRKVKAGITSLSLPVFIQSTASTTGEGLGSVTHSTSGFVGEYRRQGQSSWTSITLVSKTLGTYTSGGFVADTGLDGCYEFDPPDAAVAAGARFVVIRLRGAANMLPVLIEIELDTVDYQTDAFGALKPTTAGRTLDVSAGGEAGIDLANVGSQSTTLNLSGTTIKTATDIETDTQDIQNRLPSGLVGGRMASIAEVVGDKTGFSLASNGMASVTSWTVSITGNITGNLSGSVGSVTGNVGGNVTGSVGSISGVTFPASFGSWTAPLTTSGTASAVWDALLASYTVTGSFGARVVRSLNSNNTVQVTGSHHVAADIHELQPAVIASTHFAPGAIDANALAASAATEVATAVGTLQVLTDLVTMIVNDGTANARFSTSALQNAPSGGGGGGSTTVNVLPYTGAVPDRVEGTTIKVFYNELTNVSVGVTDATGAAVTLDAKTLRFCVEDRYGVDVLTLTDGDITRSGSTFTVQIPQSLTDTVGANYRWSLRDLTGSLNTVLIHGQLIVAEAAEDEA